jgi:L-iditol 2-dehydrogenase
VARLYGVGDLRVSDEPTPEPGPGRTLVRVAAVGICGSDLHWYAEGGIGDARLAHPLIPGHEMAGVTPDGTLVAIDPAIPCRRCEMCHAGHHNLCPDIEFAGHGEFDGGLREYIAWPHEYLFPLPAGLSAADGAMLEPLGVAIHAMDLAHPRPGMTVAVAGCGPIGLLLVQLARACGASYVLAADPLGHRREAAARYGADEVTATLTDGRPPGLGVDVAFEVGGTDEAVLAALAVARPGARVPLVGIPATDQTAFPAALARRKGLTLTMVRRMGAVYPRAIALVARGTVDVSTVVTDRYPLEDAAGAFRQAAGRCGLKTIIEPAPR